MKKIWTLQVDPETGFIEHSIPIKELQVKKETSSYYHLMNGRKISKASEFTKIFFSESTAREYRLMKLKEVKKYHRATLRQINIELKHFGVPKNRGVHFMVKLKPKGEEPIICSANRAADIIGIKPSAVYNAISRGSVSKGKYRLEKVV